MSEHLLDSLIIRPARAADRNVVMALVAQIWDGEDYIPEVWDEWLAAPHGELTVAELAGRVVCLSKLTRLRPGVWWLEGMRVDPAFRGRGIATVVTRYQVQLAERLASGQLGLGTSSENEAVHRLVEHLGFARVAAFVKYTAEPRPEQSGNPFLLGHPDDESRLHAALAGWPGTQACAGLAEDQWSWYPLVPALADTLAAGRVWLWRPNEEQMAGLVVLADDDPERVTFSYVNSAAGRLDELLHDLRGWPGASGLPLVYKAPADDVYRAALAAAGWQTDWDMALWIFFKHLRGASPAQEFQTTKE